MVYIQLQENENLDKAISRFKTMAEKEGIIREYKQRQYFQKPSALKHVRNKSIRRKELLSIKKLNKNKMY